MADEKVVIRLAAPLPVKCEKCGKQTVITQVEAEVDTAQSPKEEKKDNWISIKCDDCGNIIALITDISVITDDDAMKN
jgi:ribosomal protein S27E